MEIEKEVNIYDWDKEGSEKLKSSSFRLLDTTLRDGLQTPGIIQPSLEDKLRVIDYDAQLGIEAIDVCLPADPSTRYFQEGVKCANYINTKYPQTEIFVLARTIQSDVNATMQFAQDAGCKVSVILFRGSSDLRLLAEDWHEDSIINDMGKFTKQLVGKGLNVTCATEDSTRTRPDFLKQIFEAGRAEGANEFCIADTVGYADPWGIKNEVSWLKQDVLDDNNLQIQYHGHNDTGNAVSNSIAAIAAGAKTIHVTHIGMGERAGNASTEGVLANLTRRGINKYDLHKVVEGSNFVAEAFGVKIPNNHPLIGADVFSTESGIHAAGIDNARKKGLNVSGIIYSAVSPEVVGRETIVNIGPLGGIHSVKWVLDRMGVPSSAELTSALLMQARIQNRALTPSEIKAVVREVRNNE